jgi:hypothetical protein
MGKNLKTGNKSAKSVDRKTTSERLVPLPKMYQMGIAKGKDAQFEKIKDILFANSDLNLTECCWIPVEGTQRFQLVLDEKTLDGILDLINEDD